MANSDLLTNGNGKNSVPKFPNNICTFCYKSCHYSYGESKIFKDSLKLFINLSERFVKRQWISSVVEHELNLLGCCGDCHEILESFCEIYHEYKCSELRLEWRLKSLINIMRLANRVPSRVKKLKQAFKNFNCDESETILNSFTTCRQGLISNCSKRLSETQPRVVLERQISNNGHFPVFKDETATSPLPLPERLDRPGISDEFLGWIMTYSAVVMLATTTPVVSTPVGFNEDVGIEEDISCSVSVASYSAFDDDEVNMHYVKEENIYEDIWNQSMMVTDAQSISSLPSEAEELNENNEAVFMTIGKMEAEEPDTLESITEENADIGWDDVMKIEDNQDYIAEENEPELEFDGTSSFPLPSRRYTSRENRKRTYQSTNKTFKKRFGTEAELEAHKNRKRKYQHPFIQCPKCKNKYRGRSRLNRHLKNVHDDRPRMLSDAHVCPECDKTFNAISRLEDHLTCHNAKETRDQMEKTTT